MTGTHQDGGKGSARNGITPTPIRGYDDWPDFTRSTPRLKLQDARAQAVADTLGILRPAPPAVQVVDRHEHDGLEFTRLSYRVGYGPTTLAWLVRPSDARTPLPGVLALHAHGGRRWAGADTLVAPGPGFDTSYLRARRREGYSSRAVANEIAREGFAVLANDTFSWGSRRFDLSSPPPKLAEQIRASAALRKVDGKPQLDEADAFDAASALHEDLLAKTAGVLGTSFAGAVATDDLSALDVLCALPDVDTTRIGTVGFSGGGARAHYLGALDSRVRAVVIACMMSTFDALVPAYIETHTWMLHSPGLARIVDWPELGGIAADPRMPARSILALYGERDHLFPLEGMRAAHRVLTEVAPGYAGSFHRTGHTFTAAMQREASDFLSHSLA